MRPLVKATLTSIVALSALAAAPVTEGGRTFTTELSGANEVPPRNETATGEFSVTVNMGQQRLCYTLEVQGFDPNDPQDNLTAAHIHRGLATENGPPIVHLMLPSTTGDGAGEVSACITVGDPVSAGEPLSTRTLAQIMARPEQYYVNVHTVRFPGGAIRGQLG